MRSLLPKEFDQLDSRQKVTFKVAFGEKLNTILIERNWSQSDLAREAGIGRDLVSTYVRGRSFPEPVNMKKIAGALNMPVKDLYPPAANAGEAPFEMIQCKDNPNMVQLKCNRLLTFATAAAIVELLSKESV